MRRVAVALLGVLCSSLLPGQDIASELATAQQKIEAGDWAAALEVLLPLAERDASGDEQRLIRTQLWEVVVALVQEAKFAPALRANQAILVLWQRLHGDGDHQDVANSINNVAYCMEMLGQPGEALLHYEAALAMKQRVLGHGDHPDLADGLNNVAACLESLGRTGEALSHYEAALAMHQRIHGDADHPGLARGIGNLALCLQSLGRMGEALPHHQTALAMLKRLHGDTDHPALAGGQNNLAFCLHSMGRADDALPLFEASLSMHKRVLGDVDHPALAFGLNNVGACLKSLGRADAALAHYTAALAMKQRIDGDTDLAGVASYQNNVAACLDALGRANEALPLYEAALALRRRAFGDADHPDVANGLHNLAYCLESLDRAGEALPHYEAALAMTRRLFGESDHPDIATVLHNIASCLSSLARPAEALPRYEAALAMRTRVYDDTDHPNVAASLGNLALCLHALGRTAEAVPICERAAGMIERLRDDSRTSAALRQSLFDDLKRGGTIELLQAMTARLGRASQALHAAERSRGRQLLDLLEQRQLDAFGQAALRARQRGDEGVLTRIGKLREELEAADLASDRLLQQLTQLGGVKLDSQERAAARQELLVQSKQVATHRRQLLDERARLLGDVLPVGKVRTPTEIQSALRDGELLLEFTVTKDVNLLFVVSREGEPEVLQVPAACSAVERLLPALLRRHSHGQVGTRGRDPETTQDTGNDDRASHELFTSLIPTEIWQRLRSARRVFVAAHRELHRVPFELLVTELEDGKAVHWLENGPPISYVPSGTTLHWLRQRAKDASDDTTSLDLLAVGDPSELAVEPEVPVQGVLVLAVDGGGEGARIGMQPHDILVSYDDQPLLDDKSLRDARTTTEAAIEDGKRAATAVPIAVWRRGETLRFEANAGALGIQVAKGPARAAYEASLGDNARMERITRNSDLERLRQLPPLRGARLETEAIEAVFAARQHKTRRLLGAEATEPAVFDLAPKAKYLHFACHGLAEEYAGQSLSMLVLSRPRHVLPGDDGLLKLGDLLQNWPGRLSSCRLVVLSACRTNVGPTFRDEAPQALPVGFLFAGVPAVISSLWAVDDASTRELMTDFYGRLLAGETDRLAAFTAARRALRAKYPDPFHWAPFLYIGSPD